MKKKFWICEVISAFGFIFVCSWVLDKNFFYFSPLGIATMAVIIFSVIIGISALNILKKKKVLLIIAQLVGYVILYILWFIIYLIFFWTGGLGPH